ncbi:MAG: prenyltransferase [Thiohalomonadaceae bacterium]
MAIAEPTVERFSGNPVAKYVAATRPPFLLAALIPCFIGLSTVSFDGASIYLVSALLTIIGALVISAGVNVLNDYYDALNGTDGRNTERLFPFTGGSRFIQNGVLTERHTALYGAALMGAGMLIGFILLPYAGTGLLLIGVVGVVIGWGYSAPPLAFNHRGLGEICVAVSYGSLITVGTDMVQRGELSTLPLIASASYGLLVACLLYVNQFPDMKADAAAGKRHWVVRLGVRRARWGYLAIVLLAYGLLPLFVLSDWLPAGSLLGLLTLPLSLRAAGLLLRYGATPARLVPAIKLTLSAMVLHGLLLSVGMMLG